MLSLKKVFFFFLYLVGAGGSFRVRFFEHSFKKVLQGGKCETSGFKAQAAGRALKSE